MKITCAGFLACITVTVVSCDRIDASFRDTGWRPVGANAGNIAAMVAEPRDLIRGRGDGSENSNPSAVAVIHIWQDQPKPLLDKTGGSSGAGGPLGGGPAAGTGSGSGG
jgi:type IV pilus biogenesis protein CpaD/CtpE